MSHELITAAEAAAVAVSFLSPYLVEAGKEAAKTVGKETANAGLTLLGWLRRALTGRAGDKQADQTGEALAELEKAPTAADDQAVLRKQLTKLLEADPALLAELRELLSVPDQSGRSILQNVIGDNNKVAQVGDNSHGNSISIS